MIARVELITSLMIDIGILARNYSTRFTAGPQLQRAMSSALVCFAALDLLCAFARNYQYVFTQRREVKLKAPRKTKLLAMTIAITKNVSESSLNERLQVATLLHFNWVFSGADYLLIPCMKIAAP